MYPLVVILGYSLVRNIESEHLLVLPFTVMGLIVSGYHSYIQRFDGGSCGSFGCSQIDYQLFGVLTIPNQAFIAFATIVLLLVVVHRQTKPQ